MPNGRGPKGHFTKGNRMSRGRPKGADNEATKAKKKIDKTGLQFAQQMLDDPVYRRNLAERMRNGTAPHMDSYIWNRLVGKPKEKLSFEGKPPFIMQMLTNEDPLAKQPEPEAE